MSNRTCHEQSKGKEKLKIDSVTQILTVSSHVSLITRITATKKSSKGVKTVTETIYTKSQM
jgi:hypothetical protein